MDSKELIKFFEEETKSMLELCKKKNSDYAGYVEGKAQDAFANFTTVEAFGCVTTEQGFFTRMTDKMARISSFIKSGDLQVKDEAVTDSLRDLANYSILFMAYLEDQKNNSQM